LDEQKEMNIIIKRNEHIKKKDALLRYPQYSDCAGAKRKRLLFLFHIFAGNK